MFLYFIPGFFGQECLFASLKMSLSLLLSSQNSFFNKTCLFFSLYPYVLFLLFLRFQPCLFNETCLLFSLYPCVILLRSPSLLVYIVAIRFYFWFVYCYLNDKIYQDIYLLCQKMLFCIFLGAGIIIFIIVDTFLFTILRNYHISFIFISYFISNLNKPSSMLF